MKKTWIVACALLLVTVAGFAEAPSPAPLTGAALAVILGEPAATGSCAPQETGVLFAAKGPRLGMAKALCDATANCGSGVTRFCEDNTSPANCTSVDSNCSIGQRGYVSCNGVTTFCPVCPCDGTPACCRCDQTGDCMSCCRCGGGTFSQCNQECNPF